MSKSSLRIVLVDPLGDVLFSGESMVARAALDAEPLTSTHDAGPAAPQPSEEEDEPCPQTKRSNESGVFPALRRSGNREPFTIEPTPLSEPAPATRPEPRPGVRAA
jgi:hypothetical protein